MPISDTEELLTFADAARTLPAPDGKHPAASTLYRWYRDGYRGVHLECTRVGRALYTSREAVARHRAAMDAADAERLATLADERRARHAQALAAAERVTPAPSPAAKANAKRAARLLDRAGI